MAGPAVTRRRTATTLLTHTLFYDESAKKQMVLDCRRGCCRPLLLQPHEQHNCHLGHSHQLDFQDAPCAHGPSAVWVLSGGRLFGSVRPAAEPCLPGRGSSAEARPSRSERRSGALSAGRSFPADEGIASRESGAGLRARSFRLALVACIPSSSTNRS